MSFQSEKSSPDYLIMGHITRDLTESGSRPGGTAVYSGILALRMGLQVALITSCPEDQLPDELKGLELVNQNTDQATTFKNIYSSSGREQYLIALAKDLDYSQVPEEWASAKILHLGPVAGEIKIKEDQQLISSSVCYSLQGWLRDWKRNGKVFSVPHRYIKLPAAIKTAAILSIEDLGNNREPLDKLRNSFPLLILTLGKEGAEIYYENEMIPLPASPAVENDPTGAGDIFAASFMIYWVLRGKSMIESARLAAKLGSLSVTRPGLDGIPAIDEIQEIEGNTENNPI